MTVSPQSVPGVPGVPGENNNLYMEKYIYKKCKKHTPLARRIKKNSGYSGYSGYI